MNLADLRDGACVLVDANLLLYGLRRSSQQSLALLQRCASGAIEGVITTIILAEFNHRRMIQEAQAQGLVSANPARALGERRNILSRLSAYAEEVRNLISGGLSVEPVLPGDFRLALEFQKNFLLLTNDSLNLAVARRLGVTDIATADKAFESVQGFTVYHPTDIP
ncbi:MAG: PIN domain-containing protein [Puniceicoccaceae bacterium]|nr:MAG: PIN domain-containing protein [Puniceicoccaceae bacterium]